MEHILLIEDQPDTAALISHYLGQAGYQVSMAGTAAEGLVLLGQTPLDLILLDIHLPDMSGMEVLELLRQRASSPPVVMLTASASQLAEAFALGARDYVLKPFVKSELLARVSSVLSAQRHLRELNHLNQALQADRQLAAQVQRLFLPTSLERISLLEQDPSQLTPLKMEYVYLPLETVSGDVLDLQPMSNGRYLFYLGDVSGHGVHAALLMAALKSHLDSLFAAGECRPWHLMRELASHVEPLLQRHYVTLLLGCLDTLTGQLDLCNAGHPPALLLRQGKSLRLEGRGAMPIGIQPADGFGPELETHWQLQPGDSLLLCSDGLYENSEDGSVQGFAALQALAAARTDLNPRQLCAELPALLQHKGFQDDVSLMVLRLESLSLRQILPGTLLRVESWTRELQKWLRDLQVSPQVCDAIGLAWLEYGNNLVLHGQVSAIIFEVWLRPGQLTLRIQDSGPAWELPACPVDLDPLSESGRGLWLIHQLCQRFELTRQTVLNQALLEFRLDPDGFGESASVPNAAVVVQEPVPLG